MQRCAPTRKSAASSCDRSGSTTKEGGIPLILAALDNHAKHAGVVEPACGALCCIGWSDQALQKIIKDAGAEKLVRAAVGWSDATAITKKWGQMLLDNFARLESDDSEEEEESDGSVEEESDGSEEEED